MSKTVAEQIAEARDRVVKAQLAGDLNTPEKESRAAEYLRGVMRSSIARRAVELMGENVGVLEACQIAVRESGLKVPEQHVRDMARNFEENWDKFVTTAPVEVVSDAEFAELLQGGSGKGTIIA